CLRRLLCLSRILFLACVDPAGSSPIGRAFALRTRATWCEAKRSFAPRFFSGIVYGGRRPQFARELRHLDRSESGFKTLVSTLQSRAVDGLFQRVARE